MSGGTIAERQQALLVLRLQEIRVANGYLSDMGANVHQERTTFDDADAFPLINVQFVGEAPKGDTGNSKKATIDRTFRVEIWRNSDSEGLLSHLQDVKRAAILRDRFDRFEDADGSLGSLNYRGTEQVEQEVGGKLISGIGALFAITANETLGDPRTAT
jgi:hypothetical protein